jgi:MFS family permease
MNNITPPQFKRVLPVVSIVTFIGFLDTHLLIPVMALYAYDLGASVGIVGLVIGLYSIVNTPANIFFGRLVDRVGFKLPLVVGLVGDAVGMLLYSLCRLPVHLALVRVFHGITGGLVGPSTMSAISSQAGEARRGRVMAVYGMSLAAATLVGYGLSGIIASRLGYKVVFWIGGGLLALGALLSLLLPRRRRPDMDVPVTAAGGGWQKATALLRKRGLISPYCAVFAQYFSFGGVVTLLPLYVKDLGMEAFHVGIMLAAFAVMFIVLQVPMGTLSDRMGRLGLTAVGLALGVVAVMLMPAVSAFPLLMVVMAVYGAAYGVIFPSISAGVIDQIALEERGLATGVFHALLTAGVAIGAPVMGWVGGLLGVRLGLIISAGALVLAFIVTLLVRKYR